MPLVIAGNWDDEWLFRRRRGGSLAWQEEDYRREHTEATVLGLQELGISVAVIPFFKGFGLEAERSSIEDSKRLAFLCHKHGIKVGVYVGSTIMYEAFLLENPEAREWFVPDYLGRPVIYPHQTYRKRVYFMHPGYREYIKRVLRVAVEEVQADLIHFDNTSLQAEPAIFHHPLAVEDFRFYLASKYTPESLENRLGFRNPKYVLPPKVDWPLQTIDDPLFQEWTDFRCQTLSRYYEEMAAFIHGLDPTVAVDCNPHEGLSGINTYWFEGVDYPRLLAHTQAVWSEEGNDAEVTPEGILVSKIRTYKMASILENRIFTYTGIPYDGPPKSEPQMRLELAEAMAYNRQCLGMVGPLLSAHELPESPKKYIQFFIKNFRLYREIQSAADIAVLHSFSTLAFNNGRPYQSTWLIEQAMIQSKIPFDVIFDSHLNRLAKYRVLVLADQECLTESQCNLIRRFVASGGGLVATELTSLYTEWREQRRDFGLADIFNVHAPADAAVSWSARVGAAHSTRNQVGQGRVTYIPDVKPAVEKPPTEAMTNVYWKLPINWQGLIEAVRWAAGGDLSLEVTAPLTVAAELTRQKESGVLLLHLVNYDTARSPILKDIKVKLIVPKIEEVSQVLLLSPDKDENLSLSFTIEERRILLTIPSLETYGLVLIR